LHYVTEMEIEAEVHSIRDKFVNGECKPLLIGVSLFYRHKHSLFLCLITLGVWGAKPPSQIETAIIINDH